ncbi:MAG: non-heme iron oxygenase ferredoxin subunit [bacterium]|nr:non-heme iron oxygenase ferredoxin subunit [bacterium]
MSDFVTVAAEAEIAPGERIVVEFGRDWVIVFNIGGQFYAVEDMCSHEEYPLADGGLTEYALECPKHGAQFDVRTGAHLCAPAVSPVKVYDVRIEAGQVQLARRRK